MRYRRGTQAPPCPGIRGGDQRLRQSHKPLRSDLGASGPEYFTEPGTNPPPSRLPQHAPGLTRVTQRTPPRAAMFSTGSRGEMTPEAGAAHRPYFRSVTNAGRYAHFLQPKPPTRSSSSAFIHFYSPLPLDPDATQRRFVYCFIFRHRIYVETSK